MTPGAALFAALILLAQALPPSAMPPAAVPPATVSPAAVPPALPEFMPTDLLVAFTGAERAISDVSACFGEGTELAPARLEAMDAQFQAISRRASGVWGQQQQLQLPIGAASAPSCDEKGASATAERAEARLAALSARLDADLLPASSGVWFGTMPLCGQGPVTSQLVVDIYTARPALILTLGPDASARLAALTTRQLDQALAWRAGGRVIVEPVIREPITGGKLQVEGAPQPELERLAAALKACPKTPAQP